jgi:hypothetical protein
MRQLFLVLVIVSISISAFSQSKPLYQPRPIEKTIGEQYIMLPLKPTEKEVPKLHKWYNPSSDQPVSASEGGHTVLTLLSITSGYYVRLTDSTGIIYMQYTDKDAYYLIPNFILKADLDAARAFLNKTLWLKNNKKSVTVTGVELCDDINTPIKFTYRLRNGEVGNVKSVISGTNFKVTDPKTLFDNQFYTAKPE